MTPNPVIIRASHREVPAALFYALVFIPLGVWIFTEQPDLKIPLINNPIAKYGIATTSILYPLIALLPYLRKFFDNKPGIIIDDQGITDYLHFTGTFFVPWTEISGFLYFTTEKRPVLAVRLFNPERYIDLQKSGHIREVMAYNRAHYGSPMLLPTRRLKYNTAALYNLLAERLQEARHPGQNYTPIARSDEWYAESNKKRVAFTAMLREQLPDLLSEHSYTLTYDNKVKDQKDSHNWVFRLEFTGSKVIAVFNDDWRDYVEYFTVTCDGTEAFVLNTDEYENAELAFEAFKQKISELA